MENMSNMLNEGAEARITQNNEEVITPTVTAGEPSIKPNYSTIGNSIPADLKEDDIKVVVPRASAANLAKATGHKVSPEALRFEQMQPPQRIDTPPAPQETTDEASEEPHARFLSPKQLEKEGIDLEHGEVIDINQEAARRREEEMNAIQQANDNELSSILQASLNEEAERNQRLDNTLNADPETREQLLGDTPIARATQSEATEEERQRTDRQSTNPGIDPYELMPSYTEDEPKTPEAEDVEPDPGTDEYAMFIKNLPVVTDAEPAKGYAITRIREAAVNVIKARPDRTVSNLGNQAFVNAVTSFKRDNFSKVTVPLVNSGFMADMVGTGVVDLQNLYSTADENTTEYDYRIERMTTVIRNVVGTTPKINPMQLSNNIHYRDYDMLAFAHLCATLKTVETVANCTECGKPFHITSKPANLLLNMDELYDRRVAIENAPNIEANSLMTSKRVVETSSGIEVTLSHPSYAEYVRCIRGFQDFSQDMTSADRARFQNMLDMLIMIRTIRLPSGVQSNNLLQTYNALMLLNQHDLNLVQREIADMRRDILVPRFGVREVVCPHCHQVIKNIAYTDLDELLFFHLSIEAFINRALAIENGKKN